MRNRTRVAVGLLGAALLAALLGLWPDSTAESTPASTLAGDGPVFVRSLQDTVPDGDFARGPGVAPGAQPGPVAYAELKRLFDYYLSTVGEQSIEAITAQIKREIELRLPAPQWPGAQRLLALYLDFKRELVKLEAQPELGGSGAPTVRLRFLAMQDLRSQYFSADETRGMFGFEDAYDLDGIARLEISQNPALSPSQKRAQLAALEAAMPAFLREDREAPRRVIKLEALAQAMRAKGASEDEVYRMRAKELDPQAAARLATLDREELAWQNRMATYLSERQQLLLAQVNASEAQRQQALAQLQQSHFTEQERPRLAAYER